jgi:spore coat protein U-like protein
MSTQKPCSVTVAVLLLSACGLSLGARAASSASTPITVSASVSQACSIGTITNLVFGAYDPIGTNATTALNATGQVSVACSKGAQGMTIGMSNGANSAADQRTMVGKTATNVLNYNIFQPPATPGAACDFAGNGMGKVAWTSSGAGALIVPNSGGKLARAFNVCGSIPAGQDAAVDTYTDLVTATINF